LASLKQKAWDIRRYTLAIFQDQRFYLLIAKPVRPVEFVGRIIFVRPKEVDGMIV